MKTNLRLMAVSAGLLSLLLCVGCDQQSAQAQDVPARADVKPPVIAPADEPKPADAKPAEAKPAEPTATPSAPQEALAVVDAKAPNVAPGKAGPDLLQNPVTLDQLKLTPALADVIKLVQAGVGEEVLMTYITNSTDFFNIGPNEILYLHDLGVPAPIITSLIHQDSTPQAMARKQAASAVQPLPPGVALNKPATNIFPPRAVAVPAANPAPETAEVVTDAPPADANPAPAVVYTVPTAVQQPATVSYFYTELAPYGTWFDEPGYGRCWRPTVSVWNSSWRPYADGGRWLWSDHGWYWYSDYTWGAHAFHYGRWACPPGRGWLWVPDIHWGPAWVDWRITSSHCGWAPAWPRHHRHHRGRDADFVFVAKARLGERRLRDSLVSPTHAATLARQANPLERADLTILPAAARERIRPVSIRAGEPTVLRNSRRELLENNGRTLTVTPPVLAAPAVASPTKSISSSSLSNPRTRSEGPRAIAGRQAAASNGDANNVAQRATPAAPSGPGVIPSGRAAAPIIMRGNGRAASASSTAPVVVQPATGQPAATRGSAQEATANNAAARRAALPNGRRLTPETVQRPRSTEQPAAARPVLTTPAAAPQPARVTSVRPEPARVISQPAVQRAPVVRSPAPVQPRVVAPAAPGPGPVYRVAPAAQGPAPVYRVAPSASVAPRAEVHRAPSHAPAPRMSAPARSSGGGSRPSRSSGDDGGRRGSR